jgi:cell division ATPase FtsA
MRNRYVIITGLDMGSSKVSAVAAGIDRDGGFSILAHASSPSAGISKGVIVNLNEAVDSISKVFGRLKGKISRRPDNVYVNINGEGIRGENSKGMIPLSIRGREVTAADMARCVNAASTIRLPFDREIIHTVVHNFSIDDQPAVTDPVGLYASRLYCETYVLTAGVNHIQNIYKCVNNAGYEVREVVFTGIADAAGVLTEEERREGAVILDIGASLTAISLFSKGVLSDISIIASGTDEVKSALSESKPLADIMSKTRSAIEGFAAKKGKIKTVVLMGGIAFSDNVVEVLEGMLAYPVPIKVGVARDVKGDISGVDSIRLATAIGLVKYGRDKYEKKVIRRKGLVKNLSAKVVEFFNNYF